MATQGTWLASCNQNALQPTHTPSTSTASTTFLLSIFNFMIAHSWWFDFFDAREIYTKWRVSVALQGQFDGSVVSYPFRTSDGWSISLASVHTEQARCLFFVLLCDPQNWATFDKIVDSGNDTTVWKMKGNPLLVADDLSLQLSTQTSSSSEFFGNKIVWIKSSENKIIKWKFVKSEKKSFRKILNCFTINFNFIKMSKFNSSTLTFHNKLKMNIPLKQP